MQSIDSYYTSMVRKISCYLIRIS